MIIISPDEDPSLRIESFATIKSRGVFTKLYFNFGIQELVALGVCVMGVA